MLKASSLHTPYSGWSTAYTVNFDVFDKYELYLIILIMEDTCDYMNVGFINLAAVAIVFTR